ncbi:MAG TPA: CHAP domain-containing protein [Gaiellaceae bacterium]|jgi:surface antigen
MHQTIPYRVKHMFALTVAVCAVSAAALLSVLPTAAQAATTTGCFAGGILHGGDVIMSPAVQGHSYYELAMQTDGNLVEYELGHDSAWHPVWQSQTGGHAGAYLALQSSADGNLVVYSGSAKPLWATFGFLANQPRPTFPGDKLCVQTDGNIVLYSTSGAPVWATMTKTAAAGHLTHATTDIFPWGQCTYGADQLFHDWNIYGQYVDFRGDARYWADSARSKGWTVGTTPSAGSIAVYQPWAAGAGSVGHVAWVLDVYPSIGKVLVKEMHFVGLGVWDTRLVTASDTRANATSREPNIQYIYETPGIVS